MRLFTAIDLPAELVGNLERLLDRLRPTVNIQWSPLDNLHITTKFIGEWPPERLHELKAALGGLPPFPALPIEVSGVGFFPNPHSPRVFWAGIHAPDDLSRLARDTDRACAALGIESEKRAFSPHLTLARIRTPVPLVKLRQVIAGMDSLDFGRFTADRFYLYESRLGRPASVYTKLSEFVLSK